jgi:hypothetical protein
MLSAAAAVFAAAFFAAGTSAADDGPFLVVTSYDNVPGKIDETEIDLGVRMTGAATAKATILVPSGYGLVTSAAPGTTVGAVEAWLSAPALGATPADAKGTLVADDPAKHTADACAPGTHAAVWNTSLNAAGQTFTVPIYVDAATGAQAATASYVLQACFASPDVAQGAGGAPLGARLDEVDLDLANTFTLPGLSKSNVWTTVVTPYVQGQTTTDTAATYELRSQVPAPHVVQLKTTYDKKRHVATFSGRVTAAGKARPGVRVHILAGTKPTAESLKAYAVAQTNATGAFTLSKKVTKTLYVFAYVNAYFLGGCTGSSGIAPAGCAAESIAPAFSNGAVVKVK